MMHVSPLCDKVADGPQTVVEGRGCFTKCGLPAWDTAFSVNGAYETCSISVSVVYNLKKEKNARSRCSSLR